MPSSPPTTGAPTTGAPTTAGPTGVPTTAPTIDRCSSEPCLNNGNCTTVDDTFECACPAPFAGFDCSIDESVCASNPCVNGDCEALSGGTFVCNCPPDFTGQFCENLDLLSNTGNAKGSGGGSSASALAGAAAGGGLALIVLVVLAVVLIRRRTRSSSAVEPSPNTYEVPQLRWKSGQADISASVADDHVYAAFSSLPEDGISNPNYLANPAYGPAAAAYLAPVCAPMCAPIYDEASACAARSNMEIDPRCLVLGGPELGRGAFGLVQEGVLAPTVQSANAERARLLQGGEWGAFSDLRGSVVAVKSLLGGNDGNGESAAADTAAADFLAEIKLMAALAADGEHPNVLCAIGFVTASAPLMIVTPLAARGSLRSYLRAARECSAAAPTLSPQTLLGVLEGVAVGMHHVAACRVVHADLAARNVLLDEDGVPKVADFGLAKQLPPDASHVDLPRGKVPAKWTAPETLAHGRFSEASDVWSFGVLMWEVFTFGASPFPGLNTRDVLPYIEAGNRLPRPPNTSGQLFAVARKCWEAAPSQRPGFGAIAATLGSLVLRADKHLLARRARPGDKYWFADDTAPEEHEYVQFVPLSQYEEPAVALRQDSEYEAPLIYDNTSSEPEPPLAFYDQASSPPVYAYAAQLSGADAGAIYAVASGSTSGTSGNNGGEYMAVRDDVLYDTASAARRPSNFLDPVEAAVYDAADDTYFDVRGDESVYDAPDTVLYDVANGPPQAEYANPAAEDLYDPLTTEAAEIYERL